MKCPLCESCTEPSLISTGDGKQYLKCGICGLVWLAPRFRVPAIAERERYLLHKNSTETPEYCEYLRRLGLVVSAHFNQGASGLDYGCGPVEGMKAVLEPNGFKIASYDPFFFPDREVLKYSYDFVLCNEAAEHFYFPRAEFDAIEGVLKLGGILGVSSRFLPDLTEFSAWGYRRDPTHVCFYSPYTVQWLAAHYGWRILKMEDPIWIFRKI